MRGLIFIFMFFAVSCASLFEEEPATGEKARLYLNFNSSDFSAAKSIAQNADLNFQLDTSDFYLSVKRLGEIDEKIFEGRYSLKPDAFELDPGTYCVEVSSGILGKPEFSRPVYADRQTVTLNQDDRFVLSFFCRQVNAGIRMKVSKEISQRFSHGFFLLSDSLHSIKYGYDESRYLFFQEGRVRVKLVKNAVSFQDLLERYMYPGEMLTLVVGKDESSSEPDRFGIKIDTTRFWKEEYVEVKNPERKPEGVSVDQAMRMTGHTGVWVYGYIVGGDIGTKTFNDKGPFKKDTHFALALSSSEKKREKVMAVELPVGPIRDELNLMDHRELLGRKIYVKVDIVEKYYGYPGLKSMSEFRF